MVPESAAQDFLNFPTFPINSQFISSLFSALSSSHSQRKVHKPSNEHTTATKFNLGFLPFIKIRGKEWVRSISQEYIHSLMICSKLPQTKDFIHCIKCEIIYAFPISPNEIITMVLGKFI
ncbi:hypothetical protein P8452_13302 [Trifolium repens]|nr:hypothetical protein P8452_13302 [Trifolium repens]